MHDIFRRIEFGRFSYEEDPEGVVDMHRCMEVLENSWFDSVETCRMHSKMVSRTPGSIWVLRCSNTIFGHASLFNRGDGTGMVCNFRVHPDFRYGEVVHKLLNGLLEQAAAIKLSGLVILADRKKVREDLQTAGLRFDRAYSWFSPESISCESPVVFEKIAAGHHFPQISNMSSYLGSPLTPQFVVSRSVLASDYNVFGYSKPQLFKLACGEREYFACNDGREWYVFREGKEKSDAEAIRPVVSALAEIIPGSPILLSEKSFELGSFKTSREVQQWDFFVDRQL